MSSRQSIADSGRNVSRGDGGSASGLSILHVVTDPMTVRFLMEDQLSFLASAGLDVAVASAPGAGVEGSGVSTFPVASLRRQYSPLRDLAALVQLLAVMRRFRPQIVNASTPKAGLLGMLAAKLMRVPIRVYTLRGLRLQTARGPARVVLGLTEKLAAWAANRVVCVSESLRQRAIELRLVPPDKTVLLGRGSSNGVDVEHFQPGFSSRAEVSALRERLGIPDRARVVGFVGRLTKDKGIEDLCEAVSEVVAEQRSDAWLLLVGDHERGDPVSPRTVERLRQHPRIVTSGFVDDPALYYGLMTVVALPSYREGFPNVPLEAAACGLPVVGYGVTGTVDAVEDGVTGTLVEAGRIDRLAAALGRYLDDPELARQHGEAGRRRVEDHFRREIVWANWLAEYHRLAAERLVGAGVGPGSA